MGALRRSFGAAVAIAVLASVVLSCSSGGAQTPHSVTPGTWDWPTYGHDAQHTFAGRTTLTNAQAPTLRQAWEFPTGDAVTATPTVVGGSVYVGSWDGYFYAIDLRTGAQRWKFALHPQPAVSPQPGQTPRDVSSDGGMVTSSAWFEAGARGRPDLVLFAGGYTLYALTARDGKEFWSHDYTGRPDRPPDPLHDSTRIFSSPTVVKDRVIVGVSVDGERDRRGYIVAANLQTGNPAWIFETDVDAAGRLLNDGCGSVWSSATLLPAQQVVVFGIADCHFNNPPPLSETVVALAVADGHLVWSYRPVRADKNCDLDFGATANAGVGAGGAATFLGVGAKDGTYYALDPKTGQQLWSKNVVFGGFSGGFIATAAYDGKRVYGSTSIGDFGRFEHGSTVLCDAANPADVAMQEPSVHALDAQAGGVVWEANGGASFGATTVAGGMTFNGIALKNVVRVRDATSGAILASLDLRAPCWSGIAVVGDAVVLGTGASHVGSPDGVVVFTPNGQPPSAPSGK